MQESINSQSMLKVGTVLRGIYRIDSYLSSGGFGNTYVATNIEFDERVAIKEFFMKEYGERTTTPAVDDDATVLTGVNAVTSAAAEIMGRYREKFVKEAKTIAKLDHPGIVRIHDVFEENGTAYYVMDFIEGENLYDLVKREGALSEERALGYIRQVADALSYVHSHNIMHLDVKPANVLVRKSDDKAILIDFGTAKQYDSEGTQTSTTPVGLSAGYAPIEMTKPGGVQTFSPETDVYSLGATLYYLVTGQNPPDASERMEMIMEGEKFQFPKSITTTTANAIERAMHTRKQRVQSVTVFLNLLNHNHEDDIDKKRRESEEAEERNNKERIKQKEVKAKKAKPTNGFENGQEWVDLGLSVKWATCNLGAQRPEENGDYFAWGEIKTKSCFSSDNYHWSKLFSGKLTKYCSQPSFGHKGFTDNKTVLDLEDDVAHIKLGGNWRMPTWDEFKELYKNCRKKDITYNGVDGRLSTSRINGNSIFFPASGHKLRTNIHRSGTDGFYWSSSLNLSAPLYAYDSSTISFNLLNERAVGQSIRPVLAK